MFPFKIGKFGLNWVIIFIASAFFFLSCKSFETVAPLPKTEIPVVQLKPSYISLPIELDVKDIEKKVNQEVKGVLYEDNSYAGDDLKIKAWKKSDFVFTVDGNEIVYSLPLKISLQYKKIIEFPEVFADITLKFKTQFNLNKDWTLSTKTTPLGFDWQGNQGISVGGVALPMQTIADMVLKANQEKLGSEIDKAIKNQLNLKSIAANAWNQLHQPILIHQDPKLWLRVGPSALSMVPITGKNGKILLNLALNSTNEIFWSETAPLQSPHPFPDLKIVQKLNPDLSLNFSIDLPFAKINELAGKELIGKTFSSGKKQVTVKGFNSYANGGNLVVELLVEGSLKGKIYLKGLPVYDKISKSIQIKEIDFDLDSKNKLVKSAEWLLHQNILKILEEKLQFPLSAQLDEAKNKVNENLKDNKQIKGITIKGVVSQLEIEQLYLFPNSIKVAVLLKGKAAVLVNGISEW